MSQHIIKNFTQLATNMLRRDTLAVLEAGLAALDTKRVIKDACRLSGNRLTIKKQTWDLSHYDHLYVIGIGKAAFDSAKALEDLLGKRITDGVILDVKSGPLKRMKSIAGTHPFPSMENMRATGEIMGILKQVDSRDLVIVIISGGGSALLCWPFELKCNDLVLLTKTLMHKGATIEDINTIRKHLSEVQGGQLARLAYPATVAGLVFSDVPGDDLAIIASGPTVLDTTTIADAQRILKRYDLLRACQIPHCEFRETPKDSIYFKNVTNLLLVTNERALAAMEREAKRRKYRTRIYSRTLTGEAREVGKLLAGLPKSGEMVFAAGETTVTVVGTGTGGRNQEVALGAWSQIPSDGLVVSCASDGIDNSPAAGALMDVNTKKSALRHHLNWEKALQHNDCYPFLKTSNQLLITGDTGTNVSDLMIAARAKQ